MKRTEKRGQGLLRVLGLVMRAVLRVDRGGLADLNYRVRVDRWVPRERRLSAGRIPWR